MRRALIGGVIGLGAYLLYRKARGTGGGLTNGLIQLADPYLYAAIASGAVIAHGVG